LAQSCEAIEAIKTRIPESAADVDAMLVFLKQSASSQRGIVR
jgi:hypothetical protein